VRASFGEAGRFRTSETVLSRVSAGKAAESQRPFRRRTETCDHGLRQRRHGGIVRTRAVGDRGHVRGGMNASGVRGPKRSRRSRNGPWLPAGLGKIAISFHPHAEGAAVRRGDFAGILRLRK
jgi:hypothetical protein